MKVKIIFGLLALTFALTAKASQQLDLIVTGQVPTGWKVSFAALYQAESSSVFCSTGDLTGFHPKTKSMSFDAKVSGNETYTLDAPVEDIGSCDYGLSTSKSGSGEFEIISPEGLVTELPIYGYDYNNQTVELADTTTIECSKSADNKLVCLANGVAPYISIGEADQTNFVKTYKVDFVSK